MKNKVTIFLSIFNLGKNQFMILSLGIFIVQLQTVYSQHREKFDSLISIYYSSELADDTQKVKLLNDLSLEAALCGVQGYNKEGELKEPSSYFLEALLLSIKLDYKKGKEMYLKALSASYNQKTDLPVIGLSDYDDGISNKKFKELHYYRNKKHFGSLDNYIVAIETLQKNNLDSYIYKINFWIGLIYFDWYNYKNALKHFKSALQNDGIFQDSLCLSDVYQCIGASCFYLGDYDSAIISLQQSLHILNQIDSGTKKGICLINLGEVYSKKSDFRTSEDFFNQALNLFMRQNDSVYVSYSLNELGIIYMNEKKFQDAEKVLKKSLNISLKLKKGSISVKTYKNLADLYGKMKDFEKAYFFRTKEQKIKDSLLVDEVSAYFDYYENNWQNAIGREITKKEREALTKNVTKVALNKTRLFLIILGFLILLIFFISVYTYRMYLLKQKANEYLSELNKSREKLLSIISHDVRGPIIGFIDLLEPLKDQLDKLTHQEISNHLTHIIEFAHSIQFLIENLLEWTKAQHGFITFSPEVFPLAEVVNPNIDIYSQLANSKGIALLNNIQTDLRIIADRNMIHVVMRNLLNNAVKFSKKGGVIELNTVCDKKILTISVSDTGIGINRELIGALLSENQPIHDEKSGSRKNTGLGLVLCREYIIKCGGKIWVQSNGKDTGSKFFFTVNCAENDEKN